MLPRRICSQRPEGSRFRSYPATLTNFVSTLIPPKRAEKQAAPANHRTRCLVPSRRSGILDPINAPINLSRVETFPGAACLTTYSAFLAPKRISRDLQAHAKAAPLQGVGNKRALATCHLLQDEDDDEDEYDWPVRGDNSGSSTSEGKETSWLVPGGRVELPTKGL
jgi:hypothetical protein